MQDSHIVTDFYALIRQYWSELSGFNAKNSTAMLNFGYWPAGVENLYEAQQAFVEKIVSSIPAAARTGNGLEIGCGIGGVSIAVLERLNSARMLGIDISTEQLELARANAVQYGVGDRIEFRAGDSMSLPLDDASVDFSLCIESSFHYEDKALFLKECFRTLKPGAVAVVADITCQNVDGIRFRHGNHFESVEYYRQLIASTGFQLTSEVNIGPAVYEPLYHHILAFNKSSRSQVSKYWSLVLNNYFNLSKTGDMGYHIITIQRPSGS